jgi:DNA-binding transcriptional ArsR family regulator
MKQVEEFEVCARRLKALAEPERLRIVNCLFAGPKTVGDLAAELTDEVVKVSHHLGVLRNAGLVTATKRGRYVEYALHPDVSSATPSKRNESLAAIDLGCCRLELSSTPVDPPRLKSRRA